MIYLFDYPECALLDNATAPTDADNIFSTVAGQQEPHSTRGRGGLKSEKSFQVRGAAALSVNASALSL